MSAGAARVAAHAKLNLVLRVLGREVDGWHAIETVFLRLALADDVVVRAGGGGRAIDCTADGVDIADIGPAERNLAYRAAAAYADATGWPDGFALEITKRIPLGGGLGGGSADAGAVLRALDALAPAPLGEARLLELATPLGADVPFLTADAPCALAWGRGERMLAVPPPPARPVELLLPSFGVPTAEAYGRLAERRGSYRPRAALLRPEQLAGWPAIAALAANDFEPVIMDRHPALADGLALLRARGARIARMTGSGSTLFGIFEAPPAAGEWPLPAGWRRVATATLAGAAPAVQRI